MTYNTLKIDNQDNIVIITLNRPKYLNAINSEMMEELMQLFTVDLAENSNISGVIITGEGDRAFVAGADISEFLDFKKETIEGFLRRGHDTFNAIENFPKPVIAAIHGFALGGGCELCMACHLRVATSQSKFGQPEVNLGIIPGYGGTQRLVQLIGKSKGLELLLTGEMIDAANALKMGLINYLVDPGTEIDRATELIKIISTKGPLAIAKIIATVNAQFDQNKNGYEEEINAFAQLVSTRDFSEGATAFLEKRKAIFTGE
ncbi:MAG: enoyl-CoA hydratase/isomerase family protein [Saprospiraceae bacterium]|nr:enoyl-CoA hydratase/isomerase family protein [Saprospiraceae bacterium]